MTSAPQLNQKHFCKCMEEMDGWMKGLELWGKKNWEGKKTKMEGGRSRGRALGGNAGRMQGGPCCLKGVGSWERTAHRSKGGRRWDWDGAKLTVRHCRKRNDRRRQQTLKEAIETNGLHGEAVGDTQEGEENQRLLNALNLNSSGWSWWPVVINMKLFCAPLPPPIWRR